MFILGARRAHLRVVVVEVHPLADPLRVEVPRLAAPDRVFLRPEPRLPRLGQDACGLGRD